MYIRCPFLYNKNVRKTIFLSILAILFLTGCRSIFSPGVEEEYLYIPQPSTLAILDDLNAQEEIMLAFIRAYPGKINTVEFIDNDWTMMVNGRRFFFAHGRFLPGELRDRWEEFYPYDFYVYPWQGTAVQRRAAINHPVYSIGSSFLFDTLYFSPTEDDSWNMQEMYSFLGVKMIIHSYIRPILDMVQERIRIAALDDPSIYEWVSELRTSPPSFSWNWRSIAGTNRRSNHSYGTAIDLLPRSLGGLYTYWQWGTTDILSRETHYIPPDAVIAAFRNYGFIWGGHWDLIDTMHFEYRPEILLLNNVLDIYIPG